VGRIGLRQKLADDPKGQAIADDLSLTLQEAANLLRTSTSSIRRYRLQMDLPSDAPRSPGQKKKEKAANDKDAIKPSLEIEGDKGVLETGPLTAKITANTGYEPILRKLGLDDPENWDVVGPVRVSSWETSKRLDNGDRDIKTLYSYRARIERKTDETLLTEEDIEAAVKRMKTKRYPIKHTGGTQRMGNGQPVGYVHHQGDEQAGKNRGGGGLSNLEAREARVLQKSIDAIRSHIKAGVNITAILDNAAGDRVENIVGHYPSQNRTTETMRTQINYAIESDIARTEAFASLGLPITKVYTPSNHGEMRGVTSGPHGSSESDNWDLIIAEQVKRILDRSPIADQITWHIPHDDPFTLYEFAGVRIGSTHGHKADKQGKLTGWVLKQVGSAAKHTEDKFDMEVMLLGHKHHFHMEDVSGTMMIQTGSLDDGSDYFKHATGDVATGCAVGFLVAPHFPTRVAKIDQL
jgi:hypothetical protein